MAQKQKYMDKIMKVWKKLRTATPVAHTLKYIIRCVIDDITSEQLQSHFPTSTLPFDLMMYETWRGQADIG